VLKALGLHLKIDISDSDSKIILPLLKFEIDTWIHSAGQGISAEE